MNLKPIHAIAVSVLLFGVHAQADITSGLVLHLPLNETTGNTAADASGNSNTGYLTGELGDNSQWQPARIAGGMRFNADYVGDDVITVPDPGMLDFGPSGIVTLSLWVRGVGGQTNSGGLIAKGAGGGQEQFTIDIQNSSYRFFVRNGTNPAVTAGINTTIAPNNTWQHLVAIANGPAFTLKLYLNGQLVGTTTNTGAATLVSHNQDISIGNRFFQGGYTLPFTGLIDDVRIYNRALSDADVLELYGTATPVAPTIVQDPQSFSRYAGERITLSVIADGTFPLTYQWKQNGNNVANATNSSLTFNSVQGTNAGTYTVGVTNSVGGVLSGAGVLTIDTNPPPLTAGLIAHWKFDETTGLVAADSQSTNPASLLNFDGDDSQWVAGRVGGALRLNPPGDTIHDDLVQTDDNIIFPDQDNFTFSIWVRLTDIDNGANPRFISPGTHWMIWSKAAGGVGLFSSRPSPVPEVGIWKQFVMTFDRPAGSYSLYVNGTKVVTNTTPFPKSAPGAVRWIIAHSENPNGHGEYLRADIDDVRIYNRQFTDADAVKLYADAGNYFKIGRQPIGGTRVERDAITMSIGADGNLPVTYQWQRNGTNLAGATRSTLSLPNLTLGSGGDYRVLLTSGTSNLVSDVATLIVQPAPAANLANALVAHWKFDETSGVAAEDASGNGNTGVLRYFAEDDTQWRSGVIGGALMMNEGAARTNLVGTAEPFFGLQNSDHFTFTFWAKRNPGTTGVNPRIITPTSGHWVLWTPNRGVGFFTTQPSMEIVSNSWRHFVVTFDRTNGSYGLIVDGVRQLWDIGGYSRPDPSFASWVIGHSENTAVTAVSDSFTGLLDDMRVYNRILNMNDVDALYFAGATPRISIGLSGNNYVISWAAGAPGYRVQSATLLDGLNTVWTTNPTVPTVNAETSTQSVSDPAGPGPKYYRLIRLP